jgi:hypothetical protein
MNGLEWNFYWNRAYRSCFINSVQLAMYTIFIVSEIRKIKKKIKNPFIFMKTNATYTYIYVDLASLSSRLRRKLALI